jgi:ParB family chromosome partitioning protein
MRHDSHYVEELSRSVRTVGRHIAIDQIEPNPEQPRSEFGDLSELSASIKEKGVLEPLLVTRGPNGRFMIIAGERRWRASNLAGLTEVPCIEMDLDEQGVAEIALIENLQRKDLTIWEEADGLKALADKFGYKQDEIAQKISKSRSTVTELMTIAGLPQDVRDRCRELNINSKANLLEVARQFDDAAMHSFLDDLRTGKAKPRSAKTAEKARATNGNSAAAASKPHEAEESAKFVFEGGTYKVEVTFSDRSQHSRRGVLEALKTAFEAAKDESTDV